jgi:hypothetical protein
LIAFAVVIVLVRSMTSKDAPAPSAAEPVPVEAPTPPTEVDPPSPRAARPTLPAPTLVEPDEAAEEAAAPEEAVVAEPGEDPAAAEPEETAEAAQDAEERLQERYGIGMQPTHRLTTLTKIFSYSRKLPYKVHELPGADALIDKCIIAMAPRQSYPAKVYPGYETILLSCAGEMKVVCEILGCEPQQACVTAASQVKPCQ